MRVHLIQSREEFGPPERREELREVWRRNDILFDEQTHPTGRPSFSELFRMCKPDRVNVIANADIYLERLAQGPPPMNCWALSRYDIDPTGAATLWDHTDSQDCWIVAGGPYEVDAPYPMGVPGCDNALIHALEKAGFKVSNPSKTIHTYHLHLSNYRSYLDGGNGNGRGGKKLERVPPPYGFSKPTEL